MKKNDDCCGCGGPGKPAPPVDPSLIDTGEWPVVKLDSVPATAGSVPAEGKAVAENRKGGCA